MKRENRLRVLDKQIMQLQNVFPKTHFCFKLSAIQLILTTLNTQFVTWFDLLEEEYICNLKPYVKGKAQVESNDHFFIREKCVELLRFNMKLCSMMITGIKLDVRVIILDYVYKKSVNISMLHDKLVVL